MTEKKLIELFKDSADKLKRKEKSSTALHSMGGYGAFRLGLYHSDIFNSFASHSAPIHLESLNNPFLINVILNIKNVILRCLCVHLLYIFGFIF